MIQYIKSSNTLVPSNTQSGEGLHTLNSDTLIPEREEHPLVQTPFPVTPIIQHKSREHDQFDHAAVIQKLPKLYQERAKKLLEVFDLNEDQLTYNETGILFINGVAIIGSNFFQMLPHLFGAKPKRVLPGFNQLVTQICSMGYGKLINGSLVRGLHRSKPIPNTPEIMKELKSIRDWFYIGP